MIRLYGHGLGWHSFAQVTAGLRLAAEQKGILAGFVPVDGQYNDEIAYPGGQATIGLNAGAPGGIRWAHSIGQHKERWLLIAPNASRIPALVAERVKQLATGVLSPSRWGCSVLKEQLGPDFPVRLCQHGVFPAYRVNDAMRDEAERDYDAGKFEALHMTSTATDRKGTRQLLDAWGMALGLAIPGDSKLHVLSMNQAVPDMKCLVEERKLWSSVVVHDGGNGAPPERVANLYSSASVVIQPSRAEGFGLCPLEAMACGTPVVATYSTGHADYLETARGGVVRVASYGEAPIGGEGPGAMAPTVSADDVLNSLGLAYSHWKKLAADARAHAPSVARDWSWAERSGTALEALLEATAA